jgi:hypothetical protein
MAEQRAKERPDPFIPLQGHGIIEAMFLMCLDDMCRDQLPCSAIAFIRSTLEKSF